MKRLIPLTISAAILAAIMLSIDRAELVRAVRSTDHAAFAMALTLFIPLTLLGSYRWKVMAANFIPMPWGRAISLTLAAQAMNVVLPSKLGDLTKAYFLKRSGAMGLARATNLVIFEKMLDMASLFLLAVLGVVAARAVGIETIDPAMFNILGLIALGLGTLGIAVVVALYAIPTDRIPLYGRLLDYLAARPRLVKLHALLASSHEIMALLQRRGARRGYIATLSVLMWCGHMLQIYYFFASLEADIPPVALCSLMPLAIFIGLLPISLFGLGTRDAAIIFLFAPWAPKAVLAGVSLYIHLRYLVPALAGLPFVHYYMNMAQGKEPEDQKDKDHPMREIENKTVRNEKAK